ncbi:hypothetical protein [Sphingomonas adhaesiva]|uniref:hypothetical protein n=1 Tax=Sphingomonas adhaesiva TaxID=28212 RepID=UPI002FF5312B
MRAAAFHTSSYRTSAYRAQSSPGSRVVSAALSIGIAALILFALLRLSGILPPADFGNGRPLSTFDVRSEGTRAQQPTREKTREQVRKAAARAEAPAERVRPDVPQPPAPTPPLVLPGVMILSQSDYAASDVSRIKGTAPARSTDPDETTQTADSAPIGRGPGNAAVYAGDWVRRPTAAEMHPYLSKRARTGIGVILCRTAPRNRVDDCREVGETPPGTGLAGTARQAAFQFLIRPPSIGGKPVIGAWVQITYDFTLIER